MHLLNLTTLGHSNTAIDDIDNLLNPGSVASKVVQDIPVSVRRACILAACSSTLIIPLRMPPALPAGMMRLAGAVVSQIPRGELTTRTQGCRRALRDVAPVESEKNGGYADR
jgi:hypothetical protein